MTVTPETLRANQDIRDMLVPFGFAVTSNKEHGPVWFDTAPLQPFEIVAQRGPGSVYALTGPQRHVLLATSEGQAGIVAANLKECLELVVAHPYWQDILRFGGGDLSAMRAVLRDRIEDFEEDALSDDPEISEFRPLLRARLGLAASGDPLTLLHHAITVLGADVVVRGHDGYRSEPLAGRFKWPCHSARNSRKK
ncbi:hypothetical protein [Bradyrhizobium sp.]|uniref:hypothetical protein n=1 Tax=Bradyrhizobium sp. TaxID=376 RepID=UPI0025BB40EC|nr:hypothetical protein [Bradyrhizobium sp.]